MPPSVPHRRPALRLLIAAAFLGVGTGVGRWGRSAWAAGTLPLPVDPVVLTVSGQIQQRNAGDVAQFDLRMLAALPQHSLTTHTPWFSNRRKFTGVLLRDLVATVGGQGSTLRAVALNDYRVDIPLEDAMRHDVVLAYLIDDREMTIRDKGPLWIMYPFDSVPELRNALMYSRAAWQLKQIELR